MKLVEIKDIRPGQVWINDQTGLIHTVDNLGNLSNANKTETTKIRDEYLKSAKCRLIGKLGITHRIENNRLIEIPRTAEFQIDDVFKTMVWTKSPTDPSFDIGCDFTYAISIVNFVEDNIIFDYLNEEYLPENIERIGVFGVTHEFVNEREVMDDQNYR